MFGIRYLKVPPTTYVIHHAGGKVRREGAGLSFFYYGPSSVIVLLPAGSTDVPFFFEEVTSDFQDASIQGELTYRITDPAKLSALLDYSVDARQRYLTDDSTKLNERLIHATQILARSFTQERMLGAVLTSSDTLVAHVLSGLRESEAVARLGVEILDLSILAIKASPEMAKALQADAREKLLLKADEAIFERRNSAVDLERKIKENEFETEVAVEAKKRLVRETTMSANIALEERRAELVDQRVANQRKEAQARGDALRATLEPLKEVDWRTLLAAGGELDAKRLVAMGFHDLADNAGKIGNLNISPDLLNSLLHDGHGTTSPGVAHAPPQRGKQQGNK